MTDLPHGGAGDSSAEQRFGDLPKNSSEADLPVPATPGIAPLRGAASEGEARRATPPAVPEFMSFTNDLPQQLNHPVDAAVLAAISGENLNEASVLLTHRRPTLRSHGGEVSFPGGRIDPGENSAQAAIREAWEETGIRRTHLALLGQLAGHKVAKNGRDVAVHVGWLAHKQHAHAASTNEVARVIHAPIAQLVNPDNRFTLTLGHWQGPAFFVEDFVVWGFTGGVLSRLLDLAGWAQPWDTTRRLEYFDVMSKAANDEALFRKRSL